MINNEKLTCNVELILNDSFDNEDTVMIAEYDHTTEAEFLSLRFEYQGIPVSLNCHEELQDQENHFCLDKQQIGFLIDFMKRIYDNML